MITIDGKEYTREKMSDEQVQLFGIISSLSNKKQEHIQKAEQKEIAAHYRAQTTYLERLRREGQTGNLPLVSWD